MKGDFTRSTFRAEKHYTSVRMQQGRLQLDSDWNEQADIQNYLRRAQVTDMIGSGSGAAKVDPITGLPSQESFRPCKIVAKSAEAADIALLPGHFYANGVLCELAPGTHFKVKLSTEKDANSNAPNNTLEVLSSLTIDGRRLQVGDWLIRGDRQHENNLGLVGWRIKEIDAKVRTIKVLGALDEFKPDAPVSLQRVITYSSQPDFPKPSNGTGAHFAYLDVWERHITALDDPTIREVALNVPDTTTRTRTVWQLKLRPAKEQVTLDKTRPGTSEDLPQDWLNFEQTERERTPLLNAQISRPQGDGRSANIVASARLENHLYRVEIHHDKDNQSDKPVSFKWSRENGSVTSAIAAIEGGDTIRIRKSSQDIWENSTPGQWLEILTEAQDLKGETGVLVPLRRVSDAKIEFDPAGMVDGPIDQAASKVRRWDHTQEKFPQGSIPIQSEWIELENGIQVRFGPNESAEKSTLDNSEYRTGDYWLIPSRAANNAIEWPTDQADDDVTVVEGQNVSVSQPIAQPAQGIEHNYALMALVEIEEDKKIQQVYDKRILFPPLLRALDRAGDIISGDLDIRGQLSATTKKEDDSLDTRFVVLKNGNVGIGVPTPENTLEVDGKIQTIDLSVTGQFAAKTFQAKTYEIVQNPTSGTPVSYGLIQAVPPEQNTEPRQIQFSVSDGNGATPETETVFTFLNGNVGIGKTPNSQDSQYLLEVAGSIKLEEGEGINEFSNDGELADNSNSAVPTEQAVKTYAAQKAGDVTQNFSALGLTCTSLTLASKPVNAILDSTLTADSSTAIPTEKAVKAYAAQKAGDVTQNFSALGLTCTSLTLASKPVNAILDSTLTADSSTAIPTEKAVKAYAAQKAGDVTQNFSALGLTCTSLTLASKPVNAILDSTLTADSSTAIPTEKAVKAYAAQKAGDVTQNFSALGLTCTSLTLASKPVNAILDSTLTADSSTAIPTEKAVKAYAAQKAGDVTQNFSALGLTCTSLTLASKPVNAILDSTLTGDSSTAIPTEKAVKAYAAQKSGDENQDFSAKEIKATKVLVKDLKVENLDVEDLTSRGYYQVSSAVYKEDIKPLSRQTTSDALGKLNPVAFKYKNSESDELYAGFLAEEVPDFLASSDHQAVKVMDVVAVLTKAVQDNRAVIKDLAKQLKQQNQEIARLKQVITQQEP